MPTPTACFTFDNMEAASLREGYPNILALLDRHRVRATFFVEGRNGHEHPDVAADLVARGHEVGMHGWAHEPWAELQPDEEAELAARATGALRQATGRPITGFRAPGGSRGAHTEAVLVGLGYHYDASLADDGGMRPSRLGSGLAQVPFVWSAVDGAHYLRPEPARPDEVRDRWLAALERVARDGGLFLTVCHASITGTGLDRMAALDAVMSAAVAAIASRCAQPAKWPPRFLSPRATADVARGDKKAGRARQPLSTSSGLKFW